MPMTTGLAGQTHARPAKASSHARGNPAIEPLDILCACRAAISSPRGFQVAPAVGDGDDRRVPLGQQAGGVPAQKGWRLVQRSHDGPSHR